MVKPVADAYVSGAGQPIYGGRFAPAVVSGSAALGDVSAAGGAANVTASALSGSASLGDVSATGDLSYVAPLDWSRKYRFQQPRLFQRASAKTRPWTYVNSLGATVTIPEYAFHYDLTAPTHPNAINNREKVGANATYVCYTSRWIWTNLHGDYLDSNQVQQGASAWASAVFSSATAAGVLDVDITSAMQFIHTNQRWVALLLKRTAGSGQLNVVGVINDALDTPPTIEVVYSDASTATLPAWYTGSTTTSAFMNGMENTIPMSSANNGLLEFDRDPTGGGKTITSATLKLRHKGTTGAVTFGVFVIAPILPSTTPIPGAAASVPFDGGLVADSRVLLRQLVTDSTSINDVLDTNASGSSSQPYVTGQTPIAWRQEGAFDPSLWGFDASGVDLTQRYPIKNYDAAAKTTKWVGSCWPEGKYASSGVNGLPTFSVVKSDYTGYGFKPLAPGLGAIHLMMPGRDLSDGMTWIDSGEKGTDVDLWLPRSHIGAVRRIRLRFYVLLGTGWDAGAHQFKLAYTSNVVGQFPEQIGVDPLTLSCRPSDRSGKFFGGAQHVTNNTWAQRYNFPTRLNGGVPDDTLVTDRVSGGYGGTSGGNIGYQGRMYFKQGWHEVLGGPAEGGIQLGMEFFDMFGSSTNYLQPSGAVISGWDAGWQNQFGQVAGLGHLYPDGLWRCVEIEWMLCDNIPYVVPPAGTDFREAGFKVPVNGYLRAWIDGIPACTTPNFSFTRLPKIDWALQTAQGWPFAMAPTPSVTGRRLAAITNVTDEQYLGFASIAGNLYYGGRTANPVERHVFINGIVVAVDDCYIGPMSGVQRAHGGLGS